MQKYADLSKLNLDQILLDQLSWDQQNKLTAAAPTSITIPTGEKRRIDYSQAQPTLSCRIQELFGLTESPKIGLHQKPVDQNTRSMEIPKEILSKIQRQHFRKES